jgi:hypothetical protein
MQMSRGMRSGVRLPGGLDRLVGVLRGADLEPVLGEQAREEAEVLGVAACYPNGVRCA